MMCCATIYHPSDLISSVQGESDVIIIIAYFYNTGFLYFNMTICRLIIIVRRRRFLLLFLFLILFLFLAIRLDVFLFVTVVTHKIRVWFLLFAFGFDRGSTSCVEG